MLVVEEELGQRSGGLGLANTGRTEEQERAQRAIGILQTGARGPDGVCHRDDGLLLSHDPLTQAFLHLDQLFDFALQHLADRHAGPAADDRGDVVLVNFFFDQCPAVVAAFAHPLLGGCALLLEVADLVLQSSGALPVGALGRLLELESLLIDLFLELADGIQLLQLGLPLRLESAGLLLEAGQLLFDALQALLRGRVLFLAQALAFDLELHDASAGLIQVDRCAGSFHAQSGGGLVNQVDGFIRQEAVGDVAVTEHCCRDQG